MTQCVINACSVTFEMFITLSNTYMNVEAIFILHPYEPYKSNDESYRLVSERVYKEPHFEAKVKLEYISL